LKEFAAIRRAHGSDAGRWLKSSGQ
jgi:hypothetical protein